MTTRSNLKIVHESEAQRQYPRVRVPVKIVVSLKGNSYTLPVYDISAGGFSLNERAELFIEQSYYDATLQFPVDGFEFSLPIKFRVVSASTSPNRVGCELHDMGPREISSLRYILTSTLNGELISAGDMLNTLARDNFTKARKNHGMSQQSGGQRLKALAISLLIFCVGLGAFGFVANAVYDNLLLIHANTAKVQRESFIVAMPREGEINSLVTSGQRVLKGQALATIKAPFADFIGATAAEGLSTELISEITKAKVAGSINSPCDCVVNAVKFTDGQYLGKNDFLFDLSLPSVPKFARAWFNFGAAKSIRIGSEMNVQVSGSKNSFIGKVTAINLPVGSNGPLSQIEVDLELPQENADLIVDQPLLISQSRF